MNKARAVWIVLAIAILLSGSAISLAVVQGTRAAARLHAEQRLAFDLELAFGRIFDDYLSPWPGDFNPEELTRLVSAGLAEGPRCDPTLGFGREHLGYSTPGSDPAPGTFTLLYASFPPDGGDVPPGFPADWLCACVVFGTENRQDYALDLNTDGTADPVCVVFIAPLGFEVDADLVGCGFGFGGLYYDEATGWSCRTCYHGNYIDDLAKVLEANGYGYARD